MELELPFASLDPEAERWLDPWFARFAGKTPDEAKTILEDRWRDVPKGPLEEVKKLILENNPKSLILDRPGWLVIERPNKKPGKLFPVYSDEANKQAQEFFQRMASIKWSGLIYPGSTTSPPEELRRELQQFRLEEPVRWELSKEPNYFLIAPPIDPRIVDENLGQWPFSEDGVLRQFYYHFHGLKDMLPNYGCEFQLPTISIEDQWGSPAEPYAAQWSKAMSIFSTSCGDQLLLHQDGRVAWFFHETDEIGGVFKDFANFLESWYLPYKRRADGPLEAFWREDEESA